MPSWQGDVPLSPTAGNRRILPLQMTLRIFALSKQNIEDIQNKLENLCSKNSITKCIGGPGDERMDSLLSKLSDENVN